MTAAPVVDVHELRKVYRTGTSGPLGPRRNEFVAVAGATFQVAAGECLGIVGESGSGKSTTARMLAGLERPTAGTISVLGTDRSRPARRAAERHLRGGQLQMVFQDPYTSLDPRQTARDTIDETLRLHTRLSRAERADRVSEIAASVGLDQRQAHALPAGLSGGQRQRVAIARALAADPRVIVLDEAVSALDVSIQAQILNLLADIRDATGVAYLFITHDLAVVRHMADRVLVLKEGHIVEQGPTAKVLDHPEHPYTQRLRESVPARGTP
ncbi:ABC transporter ATP-binding protein [Streptomyces albipurpureus]|uniref:ATP-binding cassette domain-containing protein n=1 Tax=Streptomyces albipurpureus TaxID=2897419 RepID=A0ABT0ULB2_9ACTN|nr:ATP-binding cassette domain-containing protein [Streptomyces sp. CWNU-1]MCM2389250.1 ATP-binding cassette domain-containing protein [Streptomyces sp. CWNU-1]